MELSTGLFGTNTRTNALLALVLLGETHASELARLLDTSVSNVQKALEPLEQGGIVSIVTIGRNRQISLNPRYFAYEELRGLLETMALANRPLLDAVADLRKRPRRAGKEL